MKTKNKNYITELDFWRLFFALCVFVFHSHKFLADGEYSVLPYGFCAVEFFFMVSGYFMAARIRSDSNKDIDRPTYKFLVDKLKTFYKPFVVSVGISFLCLQIVRRTSPGTFFMSFLTEVWELCFTCGAGFKGLSYINGPTWYLGAMIIAMAILYPVAKKYQKYFFTVGAPVLACLTYALINRTVGLSTVTDFVEFLNSGVLRAMAGVSLGVFLNECVTRFKQSGYKTTAVGKFAASTAEAGLFLTILILFRLFPQIKVKKGYQYVSLLMIFLLLLIVFSGATGLQEKIGHWNLKPLSKLSLYIYLNHRCAINIINELFTDFSYGKKMIIYAGLTALSIILCRFFVWIWEMLASKHGDKIRAVFFTKEVPQKTENS